MKDHILILGIVLSFGVGVLTGVVATKPNVITPPQTICNYDPARAVYADTLKEQQQATERCYQMMLGEIEKRKYCEEKKP